MWPLQVAVHRLHLHKTILQRQFSPGQGEAELFTNLWVLHSIYLGCKLCCKGAANNGAFHEGALVWSGVVIATTGLEDTVGPLKETALKAQSEVSSW